MNKKEALAKGCCERIGIDGKFTYSTSNGREYICALDLPNHNTSFKIALDALTIGDGAVIKSVDEINAVGHRIVNGGDKFTSSVLVTEQVLKDFPDVIDFAPLHNPAALALIEVCLETLGAAVPNVLVFDTTFHQTMPPKAYLLGIPYIYYEKYKLRRYGAHGTSHRYVSLRCAEVMGKKPSELKMIFCHLGNGSSITAVDKGNCIDTSMGFTPLGGIIMGTRSGDLDPSVVTFIMEKENQCPKEMEDLLNRGSGILGISGISSDCRDIEKAAGEDNIQAMISVQMLTYQVKKYIGAYSAAMGGIDALVFTAGIGENSSLIRKIVCENMEYLGINIDLKLNEKIVGGGKEGDISSPDAKVKIYVIPTDEEYMIAHDTKTIVESVKFWEEIKPWQLKVLQTLKKNTNLNILNFFLYNILILTKLLQKLSTSRRFSICRKELNIS
jgi:acetate kinase